MRDDIYTTATITNSAANVVHIQAEDIVSSATIILHRDEFMGKLKQWLRTMPMDKRQEVLDELIACTLRTLE